ncbi:MAG: hypothetical protein PVH19_07240 [Planctomycetia bacterium]|jgi:hypothetical protein
MNPSEIDPAGVLNRMVEVLLYSFPVYLETTRPWSIRDPKNVCSRVGIVAADQHAMAERLIEKIHRLGAQVDPGGFPREFTAFNDLEISTVLDIAIEWQKQMIVDLQQGAQALADYSGLVPLVEEAVGNARGHLAALEELRTEV